MFQGGQIEQRPFLSLDYLLLAVDALHLLLLVLDVSDGVPLWVVHAGRSEEQPEEEGKYSETLYSMEPKAPFQSPKYIKIKSVI